MNTLAGKDVGIQRITDDSRQERIRSMKRRYQSGDAMISVERARYFTQGWQAQEGKNEALPLKVARAMKHVYENATIYLDREERIAGTWTEYFLGVPIDIERGVFNQVFEAELTRASMLRFRIGSMAKALRYMLGKGSLGEFIRNQKLVREAGAQPLNMELKTMAERDVNPYQIAKADRNELLKTLLPYWKGKTVVDRLEEETLRSGLYSKDMHEFAVALPGNTSRQVQMISTCATIATYQGHVILDFRTPLKIGLEGMMDEVRKALENPHLKGEEKDVLTSQLVALEGVAVFAQRLADKIGKEAKKEPEGERKRELQRMETVCRHVPLRPAKNFREAVQALWTIKTAVEMAHPVNLHCFGRLDQDLIEYYRNDLDTGAITRDDALDLLQELLLKIMSQNIRPESNILGNFYHRFLGSSPVTLGGVDAEGHDATNELTRLFLEAAHLSKAITNVSLRVHDETPDDLLLDVADFLRRGTSSYSLFNDATMIDAMKRRGFSEEDARDYAIMGCVEGICPGKTGSMSANALQLARLLDITMRNGDSAILAGTIEGEGPRTGDPDTFPDFDAFLDALTEQARYFIDKIVRASNLRDDLFARHLPAPLISAFMDGCMDSRKDVTQGGATYDLAGISMINSVANLVDSLAAIRELVYEKRVCTMKQLLEAVNRSFVGYEDLARRIEEIPEKWGNGREGADDLAAEICKRLFELTYEHRTTRDGPFVVYIISMITHTIDGRLSIAGPDGRRAALPYAASCNPYNVERCGATAALRSVASLPFEDVMGCAVNMKFHPSSIGESIEAQKKWAALIRTYFKLGGAQLQPTCISSETLREAKKHPEQHRDLIVKVGGYSTYFVDLGREIQDEIIARTEHGAL